MGKGAERAVPTWFRRIDPRGHASLCPPYSHYAARRSPCDHRSRRHHPARGAGEAAGDQFVGEEAATLDRARHMQARRRIGDEAEAGVIFRVADQDHRGVAGKLGPVERDLHQAGADALATQVGLDRERAEQKRRPVGRHHVPQPDRADDRAVVTGDQRQTGGRQTALAEPFGRFGGAIRHHPVEQEVPGAGIGRRLIVDMDHRFPLRSRRI